MHYNNETLHQIFQAGSYTINVRNLQPNKFLLEIPLKETGPEPQHIYKALKRANSTKRTKSPQSWSQSWARTECQKIFNKKALESFINWKEYQERTCGKALTCHLKPGQLLPLQKKIALRRRDLVIEPYQSKRCCCRDSTKLYVGFQIKESRIVGQQKW